MLSSTDAPLFTLLSRILPAAETETSCKEIPNNSPLLTIFARLGLSLDPTHAEIASVASAGLPSAKERALSVARLAKLLDYDPATGHLRWKARSDVRPEWNTRYAGTVAGTSRDGAIQVRIEVDGTPGFFLAHRIAWALHHGEWPADLVDHENGDPADNRISNLRLASSSQNNCNRRVVAGASRFKGVYFQAQRGKYAAQIKKDRSWKWLGLHETEADAARAYDTAALELHGEFAVTNESLGLFKRPESAMRSYQRHMIEGIVSKESVLLSVDMGMGKTGATLTGVRRLLRGDKRHRCLIVGPLEVAKNTWPDEIGEWEHLQDLTYTVVCGTEAERSAALKVDADLTIINRENLQWLWKKIGGAIGWRWTILVYDESSRLKGFTRRTKGTAKTKPQLTEFGVLAQARKRIERVVELSGTPSPNGLIDLGGQAFILDQGERLGTSKTKFQEKFFDKNQFSYEIKPKEGAEDKIMGLMKDLMIGLRSEDYIDLPPLHFNPIYVKLPPKLMREYREFKDTMVAEAYDVEAVSRGVLTNKLLQFANGGLYRPIPNTEPPQREIVPIHDYKLKALESVIEEAAGQPVLIAYSFKFDKERIKKRFPKAVLFEDDPKFVKNWNAGKIKIGLAHPASIGHGLNLQHGGHIQVWYGLTWSLELWDQFNRRLARPGQKAHTVFIHVIMAKGTEDENQYANLQTKGMTQDRITEHVRVRFVGV